MWFMKKINACAICMVLVVETLFAANDICFQTNTNIKKALVYFLTCLCPFYMILVRQLMLLNLPSHGWVVGLPEINKTQVNLGSTY